MDNSWFYRFLENEEYKKETKKEIFSNRDYIDWLIIFTNNHNTNYSILDEELDEVDVRNLNKIELLYEGISEYAKKNYLFPKQKDSNYFYNIKIDNIGFEIGAEFCKENIYYYFKKIDIDDINNFINFEDIMNKKDMKYTSAIKKDLEFLKSVIEFLYLNGINEHIIESCVSDTLNELKNKEMILK